MIDDELILEFQSESAALITTLMGILENCENDFSKVRKLEEYGQTVDRIMGGAKSIAITVPDKDSLIHKIGDYASLCKAVGYKASQINNNPEFYNICVALLLDATEVLQSMVEGLNQINFKIEGTLTKTFLERLKWVSSQFGEGFRESIDIYRGNRPQKMSQQEIDNLLKKLGLD